MSILTNRHWTSASLFAVFLFISLTAAGQTGDHSSAAIPKGGKPMPFSLRTTAFQTGGDIPARYTCSGEDVSPDLKWQDAPSGTQSFVLIVDDPDAPSGTFTHWLLYDIPAATDSLPENATKKDTPGKQGRNGFGKNGYGGPCPPPGKPHRYFFKLYALDKILDLPAGSNRQQLERAMSNHVLGHSEIMAKFAR